MHGKISLNEKIAESAFIFTVEPLKDAKPGGCSL